MRADPLTLSIETVIAGSRMLGHSLEDRGRVRAGQQPELVRAFREAGTVPLRNPEQRGLFLVAPLDILVVDAGGGRKQFHVTEVNGTGIGGLTNMPLDVVATVLSNLAELAQSLKEPNPLVLVAVSGKESGKNPRHNHLVHEKLLYAEALKRGFEEPGRPARVLTMPQLEERPEAINTDCPTVVVGYIKELLNALSLNADRRLHLFGRPVDAGVNDRFCMNVVNRFAHQVDLSRFVTMNRSFMIGADKGVAYGVANDYSKQRDQSAPRVRFLRAHNRSELIAGILQWLRRGRRCVIKAQGTGLGHGIEFFLDPNETPDDIIGRVDHSIRVTEAYYGMVGGAFPYTLCEFVDTCTVPRQGHPLYGHKYEARVVVYRDGDSLVALPSITKISSQGYEADRASRLSLINNITASAEAKKREGTEFMLPLCNAETLELLEIDAAQMKELCGYCAGLVRFALDQVQDHPEQFGLRGIWSGLVEPDEALSLKRA